MSDEERHRSIMRDRIGLQLRAHYQACMTEELPPRLLALVKKLDQEIPENQWIGAAPGVSTAPVLVAADSNGASQPMNQSVQIADLVGDDPCVSPTAASPSQSSEERL